MANIQMGEIHTNWAKVNRGPSPDGKSGISNLATYSSIDDLRERLKVIDPGNYTDEMLDTMSVNDMVYAVRLSDDPDTL